MVVVSPWNDEPAIERYYLDDFDEWPDELRADFRRRLGLKSSEDDIPALDKPEEDTNG